MKAEVYGSVWIRVGAEPAEVSSDLTSATLNSLIAQFADELPIEAELLIVAWIRDGHSRVELSPSSALALASCRAALRLVLHHEDDRVFSRSLPLAELQSVIDSNPAESAVIRANGVADVEVTVTESVDSQEMLVGAIRQLAGRPSTVEVTLHARARGVEIGLSSEDLDRLASSKSTLIIVATAVGPRIVNYNGRIAVASPMPHLCESLAVAVEDGEDPLAQEKPDATAAPAFECPFCRQQTLPDRGKLSAFVPAIPLPDMPG